MKKKMGIGLLVLAMAVSGTACGKKAAPPQAEAKSQPVSVTRVEKSSLANLLTISGKIVPKDEIKVVPKASGKVARAYGEVGQTVTAGQVLLELEKADIQARLDSAQAAIPEAQANVEKARSQVEKSQSQTEKVLIQVERAKVQLERVQSSSDKPRITLQDAQRNLDRKQRLFDAGAASQSELDAAKSAVEMAQRDYEVAQSDLAATQRDYEAAQQDYQVAQRDYDLNVSSIAQAEAGVQKTAAAVRQSQVEMDNATVHSPISGIIAQKNVEVGEFSGNSTPAYVVVNIDSIDVEANLTESDINHVRQGQQVDVKVSVVSDAPFKGTVTKISPSADEKAKTYPVWITIPNGDRMLKPGMFAEILLETNRKDNVPVVPAETIVDRNGSKVVYVAEGDKAVERKVTAGISDGKKVEILDGVKEGERVILSGLTTMSNGMSISVEGETATGVSP